MDTIPSKFVAVDPRNGVHLREATAEERAAYLAQPCRFPKSPRAFAVPVRVGDVLIDEDTGPGSWHGGAGF